MGQYWKLVNLDKREFVEPHKLGCGLKLWEQLANHPSTGTALIILCAAMPEPRGGGDFESDPPSYSDVASKVIGRWAGDRIALVGDYAELTDLAPEHQAHLIYSLCGTEADRQAQVGHLRNLASEATKAGGWLFGGSAFSYNTEADELGKPQLFTDISDMVCRVIEKELRGKFTGEGWRKFEEVK